MKPQAGDVVFFYNKSMGRICHVGLVESVNGKTLVTIEGNTSSATIDRNGGECRRKEYKNFSVGGNGWIHGFGRPVYTAETCSAEKVLEIAKNEIGYEEKRSPSQLDDKHANKGSGNFTKYGAWYNGGRALSEPWCAEFVSWCFYEACRQSEKPPVTQQESILAGWQKQGDKWLYYKDNVPVWGGFHYINGRWYAFDNAGFMIKGWFKTDDGWYYLGEDGAMLSGQWLQDKGKWYYLTDTGVMATNAKIRKTKGDGYDYVGSDGVYDPVKSLFASRLEGIEIVE